MERIRWWWNLVYYFHVKWSIIGSNIICAPIYFVANSKLGKWMYFKIHNEKYNLYLHKKTVRKAQIDETYIRLYLSVFLCMPLLATVFISDELLRKHGIENNAISFIGIFSAATIAICPVQNYLLGKNDEYKKYFKEFDKLFENDMRKKRLYGFLSFLTLVALFSTIVFGFILVDFIMNG